MASSLQDRLFQRIREKLPADAAMAAEVAERLHVSMDSAYRRLRGETPLVLEEARVLCEAYSLSLDELLLTAPNTLSFNPVHVQGTGKNSFDDYLAVIGNSLRQIQGFRQTQIIYLSKDLPFFYDFCFPPLFAFHYFFWMKSILQDPAFRNRRFTADCLPEATARLGREILATYASIPSVEICNTECINSTIAQIEYYREADYFSSDEEIRRLYQCLEETVEHLRLQAEYGSKFLPGERPGFKPDNCQFFFNRLILGENTILVKADGRRWVYLNYEVLDYIVTQDENFGREIEGKLSNLMKRSTLLSQTSDKERSKFFNKLLRKVHDHAKMVHP